MSQIPKAAVIRADKDLYDASWNEVVKSLLDISDRVEDAARGTAFVAIDGLYDLYGGQDQTLDPISRATIEHGLDALIGVGPGRFPAYCAAIRARTSEPLRLPGSRSEVKEFLAPMPVDLLPLESSAIDLLHDFALDTMGDLAMQSLSALQAQLGPFSLRTDVRATTEFTEPFSRRERLTSVSSSR